MKKNELIELPPEELKTRLRDVQIELSNLKFQQATRQINNPLQIRTTRREIAQIRTILHEYELNIRKIKEKQI